MSEREVLLTGIGGQGVQLAAQVLARAATIEGRGVSLFGVYGGAMRGMNTDATLVVSTGAVESPPIVSHAWAAIAMHDRYWAPSAPKVNHGGLIMVNDTTFETPLDASAFRVVRVAATTAAQELGNELGASMVMTGAFVTFTGLVSIDAAIAGMRESIPPYRQQHIAANEEALRAGATLVCANEFPAWEEVSA
ncbi:MAG: 2-oxoacid:acceptor oxidoreductase family protein [Acidimicrobiia bacterium]